MLLAVGLASPAHKGDLNRDSPARRRKERRERKKKQGTKTRAQRRENKADLGKREAKAIVHIKTHGH